MGRTDSKGMTFSLTQVGFLAEEWSNLEPCWAFLTEHALLQRGLAWVGLVLLITHLGAGFPSSFHSFLMTGNSRQRARCTSIKLRMYFELGSVRKFPQLEIHRFLLLKKVCLLDCQYLGDWKFGQYSSTEYRVDGIWLCALSGQRICSVIFEQALWKMCMYF